MVDAVLSYHADPASSGIARFNARLAKHLGVPHQSTLNPSPRPQHPLISIKTAELAYWTSTVTAYPQRSLFLHDLPELDALSRAALAGCWPIYAANPTIAAGLCSFPQVETVFCPALVQGNPRRPGLTILTFGMAHKRQLWAFARLAELLDGRPYTLCVSQALHESRPWDLAMREQDEALRGIFGDRLRMLGCLADDALAKEIREAHTVALFYEPAVRANNTTIWAALDAGTPVITNLDAQSPPELVHNVSVFDLAQLTEWPEYDGRRQDIRAGGVKAAQAYSWDRLIEKLTAVHA